MAGTQIPQSFRAYEYPRSLNDPDCPCDYEQTVKMWPLPLLDRFLFSSFLNPFAPLLVDFAQRAFCWLNMRWQFLPLGLVTSSIATNLYVSSYIGTITSLQLSRYPNGSFKLETVASHNGSYPNPAWLTKNEFNGVVYCVDEGLTVPNGSLASYKTSSSGELTQIDRHTVISGPVHSVLYNNGKALAVAH